MEDTIDVQGDPIDDGQVDFADVADAGFDTPTLNIDEYRDYRVPIKVDGQEEYVPLAEAVNGYQRQADYTRKTQEVARQAQELQVVAAIKAALDNDPAGTIRTLADHYGIGFGQQQMQQPSPQQSYDPYGWDEQSWGEPDPVDSRYSMIEQRLAAFEQAQQMQHLERTIYDLQAKYGDAFNPQEVIARAVSTGNPDLEAVYKLVDYDRVAARAAQAARDQAALAAKRQAQAVASGGSARGATGGPQSSTIADFWNEAKREAGIA